MSHLICCEREQGGRVMFFPEEVGAFLETIKNGHPLLGVILRNNNTVMLKGETPETLIAKMIEARGGQNFHVVSTASEDILKVIDTHLAPIAPAEPHLQIVPRITLEQG